MTRSGATLMDLEAENAALRELLEVYEATSIEQAKKLGQTLSELAESGRRLLDAEREASRLAQQQARRLEREFEIASQIQTSILPRSYQVTGFDIAATMIPAERVGGDYYDVIPTENGCWLGIGDVSGHGLTAGLIMMMTQSAVGAMVRRDPEITPSAALCAVNEILVENIRRRMRNDDHMTLTLLHLDAGGRLRFAGRHEELLIFRCGSGEVESITTPGSWVGVRSGLEALSVEKSITLGSGDTLVLHTDGIIEAREAGARRQFGIERLCDIVRAYGTHPSAHVCTAIVDAVTAWSPRSDDDRTLVVVRRTS